MVFARPSRLRGLGLFDELLVSEDPSAEKTGWYEQAEQDRPEFIFEARIPPQVVTADARMKEERRTRVVENIVRIDHREE